MEEFELLLQNLLLAIGVVGDVDKFADFWWSDFLVLACDEHSCDAEHLVFFTIDTALVAEPINQVNGDIQRFRMHIVFAVHFDEQ